MKNYGLCSLIFIVIALQVSFAQKYDLQPAILSAESKNDSRTLQFCLGYIDDFYKLPKSFSNSAPHQLVFAATGDVCKGTLSKNVTNKIVIINVGICGNLEIIYTLQNLGAWGVILAENGRPKDSFQSVNVTADDIHIFTGVISMSERETIYLFDKSAFVKLRPAENSVITAVVIFMIAVFTVMVGSYFSGKLRYAAYAKLTTLTEEMNTSYCSIRPPDGTHREAAIKTTNENADTPGMELAAPEENKSDQIKKIKDARLERTTHFTVFFAFVLLFVACGVILMLYFFYSEISGVVLVLYLILLTHAFIEILKKIIDCFPHVAAYGVPFRFKSKRFFLSLPRIIASVIGISLSVWWYVKRHEWYAFVYQDVLGVCFTIYFLKHIRIPSMKLITIVLFLFFLYDIFFVFITPYFFTSKPVNLFQNGESIMVRIAKGEGGETLPLVIKVPLIGSSFSMSICGIYSLLGFGDMLLPGLLVAYAYGFDLENKLKRPYYFIISSLFYALGVILASIVAKMTNSGQPALLYIVPCGVISALALSSIRKEFKIFWYGIPVPELPSPAEQSAEETVDQETSSEPRGPTLLNAQNQPNEDQ